MKNKKQGNNWTAYYDPDTKRYTKNRSIWSICLGKAQLYISQINFRYIALLFTNSPIMLC